jgi:hypothetical protein
LKDGQVAKVSLVRYDRFFLTVVNSLGTSFDIPWVEVASVDGDSSGDLQMMRGRITDEPTPVATVIAPRSPHTALMRALWPGFLLHGDGFRYAGSNDTFVSLAGSEAFAVVVGGFSAYLQGYPNTTDTSRTVPQALATAGVVIFAATWAYDIAFAPGAAQHLDQERGLALEPTGNGAQFAYHF